MSEILKSDNLAAHAVVRSIAALPSLSAMPLSAQDEEGNRLRQQVQDLEDELRERDANIVALKSEVERALEQGKLEGRAAGLLEAEDRQSERLSQLEEALRNARDDVLNAMTSLERLAALLAREALELILCDAEKRTSLLEDIIKAQLRKIERGMLLEIEVSAGDFCDEAALADLAGRTGLPSVVLKARTELPAGSCAMALRLGRMEIGLNQQWGMMRELLSDMAQPEVVA